MVETRRLKELADSASARLSLPAGPLVVALSGGADSGALAWLCLHLGRETRALHVDHGLGHSEALASAASSIAGRLGLDLEVVGVEVAEGPSPEGQAREARYAVFDNATAEGEALLTAHTLDDDAETILMNLIRGAGPRGLTGIPRSRPPVVHRPALDLRRSETREIAVLAGLDFIDDPMNEDIALTRNWIRTVIMPQLEQANPRLAETLTRTGRLIGRESDHVSRLVRSYPPTLGDRVARLPRGVLLAAPGHVATRTLVLMLEHLLGPTGVTADRIDRMLSVARGDSARQEIGGGVVAEVEGPMFVVRRGDATGTADPRIDTPLKPGLHRVGVLEFEVREVSGPCRVLPLGTRSAVFPAGTELVLRPDGVVTADGREAWIPGQTRLGVAWYEPGALGYLSVTAREGTGWTSSR